MTNSHIQTDRRGGSIVTFTGLIIYPADARPDEISIEDIAQGLSMMCRFNGQIPKFYSVAEHSCRVVDYMRTHLGVTGKSELLWGLLHDASEAYISDIVAPVKSFLDDYLSVEEQLMRVIATKFELGDEPDAVHTTDQQVFAQEWAMFRGPQRDLSRECFPRCAKRIFLDYYHDITHI